MKLLVIRHAIAMDREEFHRISADDGLRPLTAEGIKKMKKGVLGLHRLVPRIDVLVTSPLVRAVQTAEIVSSAYDSIAFRKRTELQPDRHPSDILEWLRNLPTSDAGVGRLSSAQRRVALSVRTSSKATSGRAGRQDTRKSDGGGGGRLTVAIVGHEPHLSRTISWMLTGQDAPIFELRKGGACMLEFRKDLDAGKAELLWLMKPSQLRLVRAD